MHKLVSLIFVAVMLSLPTAAGADLKTAGWSDLSIIAPGWWYAPGIDSLGARVVFLDPYTTSGTGIDADFYYDRRVYVAEFSGSAWSQPILIGSNAIYRPTGWFPITTLPMISADGNTLAYLGCSGGCKPFDTDDRLDIFVSRRSAAGWSAPVPLNISLDAIDSHIGLSGNGSTLVFSTDYNPFSSLINQIYSMDYVSGTWNAPVAISSSTVNGWSPEISSDGLSVLWISNPPSGGQNIFMTASRAPGGSWSIPEPHDTAISLEDSIGYYRLSPDGKNIFYWKITLTPGEGGTSVCTAQDLYVIQHQNGSWGAPGKVNTTAFSPKDCDGDAPPAVDYSGQRVVYPRTVIQGDFLAATYFEMVELRSGKWGTPVAISAEYSPYVTNPNLSADGSRLISLGPDQSTGGGALVLFTSTIFLPYQTFIPLVANGW